VATRCCVRRGNNDKDPDAAPGLGYGIFNETYNTLAQRHGQPSVITSFKASFTTPLPFDPRDGNSLEHRLCGQIVEAIRGKRLGWMND
jgi:methyl acetate hydrolase